MAGKIKKILGIVLSTIILVVLAVGTFKVYHEKYRKIDLDDFEYIILSEEEKTCKLTDFNGATETKIMIPEVIDGYTVVELGDYLFSGNWKLTGEIIIPETVMVIGDYTFKNCSGLDGELRLPEGLNSIGDYAFNNCSGLDGELKLPEGLNSIGDYAFNNCSGLDGELKLPEGLTSIGDYGFNGCRRLTGELNLPDTLINLGKGAFAGCSGLLSVKFPKGLTIISDKAFAGCEGLSGVLQLPEGLLGIGDYAFYCCTGLTGISGGTRALSGGEVERLLFPESLESIGDCAFKGCRGIVAASKWPEGLTQVGKDAFWLDYGSEPVTKDEESDAVTENENDTKDGSESETKPLAISLEVNLKSLKYDEATQCITGELEIFECSDSDFDGIDEKTIPATTPIVGFNPLDVDGAMLTVSSVYTENNIYTFEMKVSEFNTGKRYRFCVISADTKGQSWEPSKEKYGVPEGTLVNTQEVYVNYGDGSIFYIRAE